MAVAGFVYLFMPIVVIVAFSFNKPDGKFNIIWQEFTFDNWQDPFAPGAAHRRDGRARCKVAAIVGGRRHDPRHADRDRPGALPLPGRRARRLLLVLPLTTPEIVLGSSLATLFLNRGRGAGLRHDRHRPHPVLHLVRGPHRQGADPRLRLDARGRGHGPRGARRGARSAGSRCRSITPGILAAGLLSFALSIDDFIITFFNAGAGGDVPAADLRRVPHRALARRSTCWPP